MLQCNISARSSSRIPRYSLEKWISFDTYDKNNFQSANTLQKIPIIKRKISKEIRQSIEQKAWNRIQEQKIKNLTQDLLTDNWQSLKDDSLDKWNEKDEAALTSEYVLHFFDLCCEPYPESYSVSIRNGDKQDRIDYHSINKKWELTGALLSIAKTDSGRKLLLTLMTHYKNNPKTPKIIFYLGKNGGFFNFQSFSKIYFGIIIPQYGPLEPVYSTYDGYIDYLYSPRSAVLFHELVHLLHKIENPTMFVKRYVSLDVTAKLFSVRDASGKRVVQRKNRNRPFAMGQVFHEKREYEDESLKKFKTDFYKESSLLRELRTEFTDDEEFYTIFGFMQDENGILKRDIICESTFTSEVFGYVRCGHWGPRSQLDAQGFNVMVNYGIPNFYIDSTVSLQIYSNILKKEIDQEKEWTDARENLSSLTNEKDTDIFKFFKNLIEKFKKFFK